jgi:catechol-2,3-dioxygenase
MQQTIARGPALGHVVLNVRSLARSVPFYVEALGLRVVGRVAEADRNRIGDIVFLSFGANHHDVGLREASTIGGPAGATHPSPCPGLSHIAFRLGDGIDDLEHVVSRLMQAGAQGIRAVDHGATRSVYFNDPDGLVLEAYVGDDTLPDGPLSIVATALPRASGAWAAAAGQRAGLLIFPLARGLPAPEATTASTQKIADDGVEHVSRPWCRSHGRASPG